MSILRQFSTKHLLIAALISVPLVLNAQTTKRTKGKPHDKQEKVGSFEPNYKEIGAPMPPLRVVYPKKAVYTTTSLQNDANLFVMMFNPTCEHCEDMAFALEKNLDLFQKSHIVLIAASGMGQHLEFFENGTKVQNYPKIKMGLDSSDFINRTFIYEQLPQINIYNAERRLLKTFTGITTIDSLKPYIQ